ncbi:MAG: pitrilysin family protein [Candidatus Pacebacteria bacterium]|nr:pitrilysin family protein [Candidatus Paceibacterota bacterium]MDD4333913.1 pitrilysin family protein [Candidatus Paceibacterota bacterium]
MYKKTILKSGLRIITIPQKDTETATVLVLVKTGSKYETKEIAGISHFLEHMLFKGTIQRKTPMDVVEPIDAIGGITNAFTGEEYTGYFAKIDNQYVDFAIDWVSDIYLNSTISAKEIEKERGTIKEEFNMYLDTPMRYICEVWKALLYKDQPAGRDVIGTKKTILTIDRKQILDYMKSQYVSKNTVVCVAGKIKEDEVILKIEKAFKNISKGEARDKEKVIENQKKPNVLLYKKDTGQSQIALGFRGYDINHKDRFILEIIATILGGGMSSRMFTEIREKQGLAYDIRTYNDSDTDSGSLVTFSGLDNKKIIQGISSILKEYEKITFKKVPEKELQKAKNYLKGRTLISLESSNAKANFYGLQEILKGSIEDISTLFKKIDEVSDDDIQRVAKEVFISKNLNLALIGPFKDKDKFEDLLLNYGTKNNKN